MESKAPVRRQIVSTVLGEYGFCVDCAKQVFSFRFYNFRIIPFAGNLLTGSLGATNGWASVNFVDLQKDDTSFPSGPLSLEQATLVVSICYAGAIIGNSVFPFVVKKYGSKRTLLAAVFPQIVSERCKDGERCVSAFIQRSHFR